ncbi:ketopantoate reductase family protein [Dactylosporangium sp. CA-092794]|uniref:ketopantoate reductase family protein n=1 Tax=Dactylosporangium sp. CA-092794 TaxID=3239929 RepID=UPI003D8C9F5E
MKILMFGRGVIATIYGWALERAGHDVEFYVRPGRAAAYGETIDLDLLDTRRRVWGRPVVQRWPVRYREELAADHDFDLIVLSVQHYRLAEAADFLAPRVGKATVLVFGNLWAEPLAAIGALPVDQVAWGAPQAGGGFGEDGVLRGALLRPVVFGTFGRPPTEGERAVRQAFREAGFRPREHPDFRGWLWVHWLAGAGLHSQSLRLGSLAKLAGATGDLREALLTSRELLPLVEARGIDLRRHRGGVLALRAPTWLTARALAWMTAHFAPVRVNFTAHSDPGAEEPRAVCRDTLAEARRLGVAVPRLEAAEPSFAHEGKR